MRNIIKRHWPLLGVALVLAVVGSYVLGTGKAGVPESFLRDLLSGERLSMKEIRYTQDDPAAGMRWVLDAREVRFSGDQNSISFSDFLLRLEPEDRPWFTLAGKEGSYTRSTGELVLRGSLQGESGNGYRVYTERMQISERTRRLQSEEPVRILGPFFSVAGRGLFVDLENELVRILSEVTTIVERKSVSG